MNGKDVKVHRVPRTRCLVDWFRPVDGETVPEKGFVRFLSHFHSDHYGRLDSRWADEMIYCSEITRKLVVNILQVRPELVESFPVGQWIEAFMPEFRVIFLDANHCLGSVILLFDVGGTFYLHCGDMRFCPSMTKNPHLIKVKNKIDSIFLDTTYAHEKHAFPTQEVSISSTVERLKEFLKEGPLEECLIMISAYTIGKEKFVFGICDAMQLDRVYISPRKRKIYDCLDLPEHRMQLLCENPAEANLHICRMDKIGDTFPYFQPKFGEINKYLEKVNGTLGGNFTRVFAVLPTGWAHASNYNKRNAIRVDESGKIQVNLVPYSEHSNFPELEEFVKFLKPREVIPTVFSDEKHYGKIVHRFRHYVDMKKNKLKFFQSFSAAATSCVKKEEQGSFSPFPSSSSSSTIPATVEKNKHDVIVIDDDDDENQLMSHKTKKKRKSSSNKMKDENGAKKRTTLLNFFAKKE